MVHVLREKLAGRTYIIVERDPISAHMQHKPQFEFMEAPTDLRKAKAIARKKSGDLDDIAVLVDSAIVYKGGERRL